VAELERRDLALGARDPLFGQIQREVGLGKATLVAQRERFAADQHARGALGCDCWRREVPAVDVKLLDGRAVASNVGEQVVSRLGFGAIRWCHCDREDELLVEIERNVPLVPIDPRSLALSAMAHLPVAHADTALLRDAVLDPDAGTVGIWLDVLLDDLA
jgi:hypothetical protein